MNTFSILKRRLQLGGGTLGVALVFAACSGAGPTADGPTPPSDSPAPAVASTHASSESTPKDPRWEAWHQGLLKAKMPKDGCFHATYPSAEWSEVPCETVSGNHVPTRGPRSPHAKRTDSSSPGATTDTVGDGADWFLKSSAPLSFVNGTFPSVIGATSVDDYSIQLNTNMFAINPSNPLCAGVATGQCNGAQQAVYSSTSAGPTTPTQVYFEYVLMNYTSTNFANNFVAGCPVGWTRSGASCYLPSGAVSVPSVSIDNLSSMEMHMEVAAGGNDSIAFFVSEDVSGGLPRESYGASFPSVLGVNEGGWNSAQFGVYGDYDGNQANFAAGTTTIEVQLQGSPGLSTCSSASNLSTTETNDLNLVTIGGSGCCLGGQGAIQFMESNVGGQACTLCGNDGQPPCTPNGNPACAPGNVDWAGQCTACGGHMQPCCAGAAACAGGAACGADGNCCTPLTVSELCGPSSCGQMSDGCGNQVTCPGTCGPNEYCAGDNLCRSDVGGGSGSSSGGHPVICARWPC